MALDWIRETPPCWDAEKQHIVGDASPGIFDRRYANLAIGAPLLGEWWRVESDGRTLGYGWLDAVWGDAEILLATAPAARRHGVGTFILEQLEAEARARGLNYLYNVIRPSHPGAADLRGWLERHGFEAAPDSSLVRAVPRA